MTAPWLLWRLTGTYSYLRDYPEPHIWKSQGGDKLSAYIDQINLGKRLIIF